MAKKTPQYSLDDVKRAATSGKVNMNRTSFRRARDLGYQHEDVCDLLNALTESDYQKTHPYDNGIYDAYVTEHTLPSGQSTTVYVKFKVTEYKLDGIHFVLVGSFHQ